MADKVNVSGAGKTCKPPPPPHQALQRRIASVSVMARQRGCVLVVFDRAEDFSTIAFARQIERV